VNRLLGFLGWIFLVCRFEGYFHLGGFIDYSGDSKQLIAKLDAWPQDTPLPIVLFRKFTSETPPRFKRGLVKARRRGNGWGVKPVYRRSSLTTDLLEETDVEDTVWAPEDQGHIGVILEAFDLSDKLTRWLRGDVGWVAGPKPDIALHDFALGFEPRWRRKPLTPEMLVKA